MNQKSSIIQILNSVPKVLTLDTLVLAHLDYAANPDQGFPTEITQNHIGRACYLVGEHLRRHAFRAYGAAKPAPEQQAATALAAIISNEGLTLFKVRDIQNRRRAGLDSTQKVKGAIQSLIDHDWLREIRQQNHGRPSLSYAVNPRLGEMS